MTSEKEATYRLPAGEMPYKRSSHDIQEEITGMQEVLALYKESLKKEPIDSSSSSTLPFAIRALENDLRFLGKQLAAAQFYEKQAREPDTAPQQAEIVFRGKNFDNHTIDATFFGEMVLCLQKLTTAFSSSDTPHRLHFNTAPGSFRVNLYVEEDNELQKQLPLEIDTPKVSGLDVLVALIDEKNNFDNVALKLTTPAIRRDYVRFLSLIAKQDAEVELRTANLALGTVMSSKIAKDWGDRLGESTDTYEEDIVIVGTLKTGTVMKGKCLIQTEQGEKYRPSVDSYHASLFRGLPLDSIVRAVLTKTAKYHTEIPEPKITYKIKTIEVLSPSTLPGLEESIGSR
jgi:hypothetical protein